MDILAKLTLIFTAVGALAGIISSFMPNSWLALLIALILLYATYKLTSSSMKKSAAQPSASPTQQPPIQATGQASATDSAQAQALTSPQLPPSKKRTVFKGFAILFATLVTKGEAGQKDTEAKFWFLQYYAMWLILWIMTYTLMLLQ